MGLCRVCLLYFVTKANYDSLRLRAKKKRCLLKQYIKRYKQQKYTLKNHQKTRETILSQNTVSDVANGDCDLLREGGDRNSSDRERRLRFLEEGDLKPLRDFFRLESVGEEVWLLLFFFFSRPSFGVTALRMIETRDTSRKCLLITYSYTCKTFLTNKKQHFIS